MSVRLMKIAQHWRGLILRLTHDTQGTQPVALPGPSSGSNMETANSTVKVNVRLPCHIMAPHQENPRFVGRQDMLDDIDRQLRPVGTVKDEPCVFALCGLGGMGTTHIAIRYGFKSLAKYQAVLWVPADSYEKILARYLVFAEQLGLVDSTNDDQNAARDAVIKWLETSR